MIATGFLPSHAINFPFPEDSVRPSWGETRGAGWNSMLRALLTGAPHAPVAAIPRETFTSTGEFEAMVRKLAPEAKFHWQRICGVPVGKLKR